MKIRFFVLFILLQQLCAGQSIENLAHPAKSGNYTKTNLECNNWLALPIPLSYVDIKDLDVPGNQITVEAVINRTQVYPNVLEEAGDVVSKHLSPSDANYLLRPSHAYITTDRGFFGTPDICKIELSKTYHLAMVYDGATLKFYRNGFLMAQTAASGNLFQSDIPAHIGRFAGVSTENFLGYINEVRIWNIARSQTDIRAYMNTPLPTPTTQPGLLAYYTFDNLLNKQGNATFNGMLVGAASISQTNPNCAFIADSCAKIVNGSTVIPAFSTPDTVCVNTPVPISNTSTGASTYYWNFCVADLNKAPAATNLGNIGGYFSQPTFIDYVFSNNNYYGFLTNYQNGNLIRLDFGNSLLNTPTAVNLGNFSGQLTPTNIISEGIQMVFNEGSWYAIIVGSANTAGTQPRIFKVDFGANITNTSPTVTDWGNIGGLRQPIDLHIFKDGNNWYGFTANSENNTITRFNFTSSFNNTPTAINLGNLGNLSYPTGIYAINDNGFWRVFVVNGGNNTTTSGTYSLSRLDFGSSLLNTPTAVNLGNPGNTLQHPRDITIMKSCGQTVGFVVNGNPAYNDIAKLDFNSNLSSTPAAVSLGNTGNLSFPHSISKLFRVNDNLYSFVTNASGSSNSLTRLSFNGCTNASIASSALQNPPPVTYNTPGTYNINLSVDDGLATQDAYCRQVVVMPALSHSPLLDTLSCADSIKLVAPNKQASYSWSNGATTESIYVKTGGIYWVDANRYGCSNRDSFMVRQQPITIKTSNDTLVCNGKSVQLNTTGGVTYVWTPATGLSNAGIANPVASPVNTTQYIVTGTNASGCAAKDTVLITVNPKPGITRTADTIICHNKTIQLNVNGGISYSWLPSPSLSNTAINNPVASPAVNTTYYVTVTDNRGCSNADSINVKVKPLPVFSVSDGQAVCKGTAVQLNAAGGNTYQWIPAEGLNNTGIANPVATPAVSSVYTVNIKESVCQDSASINTYITVLALPTVTASSSNDITCNHPVTQLNASGGLNYAWQPAAGLNDSTSSAPLASAATGTLYTVTGTDLNGCKGYDSVYVKVTNTGDLLVNLPNAFSPNGDGRNECFGISRYAGLLQHIQLSVYDRFGLRVFNTTNPLNCWDGRYKGKLQDPGGFVYVLKANTLCGQIFKKGIVMLLR